MAEHSSFDGQKPTAEPEAVGDNSQPNFKAPTEREAKRRALIERWLSRRRENYEKKGDSLALFDAVAICARFGLIIPTWAAKPFAEGVGRVTGAEIGSWDVAFGRPFPKGTHLEKLRHRQEIEDRIYIRIRELLDWRPGQPPIAQWLTKRASIGPELFEQVGKEFRIGARQCKDLYYKQKKILDPIFPKTPFSANS